jgi:hypothetical protein
MRYGDLSGAGCPEDGISMEPIVVKKFIREYAFYSDKLVISNKRKILREIYYDMKEEVTYNPESGLRDYLLCFFTLGAIYEKNALTIRLKYPSRVYIATALFNHEFEKIKDLFGVPIKLV